MYSVIGVAQETTFDTMLYNTLEKTVPFISIHQLKNNYSTYTILDTREMKEYEISHLKNSIHVGFDNFNSNKAFPKNKPIVVYCSIGYRSEKIGELLIQKGYTVFNLYGGIFNWINTNNTVVNTSNLITKNIHPYNKKWSKWLTTGIKTYD